MAVHRRLGPGHKEKVYQWALETEFERVSLSFEAQKNLEVYDEGRLAGYYIPDFVVEEKVIVEIKAFATLHQRYLGGDHLPQSHRSASWLAHQLRGAQPATASCLAVAASHRVPG